MYEPYSLSDKATSILNIRTAARFTRAKRKLLKADELNVIAVCEELYSGLENDNREIFLQLAQGVYKKTVPTGESEPDWPLLLAWLTDQDPVTGYVYTHETERKRAYMEEGWLAGRNISAKKKSLVKSMRLWAGMSAQYCDIITDKTMLKSYQDAGVQYVMWRTEEDERVCHICRPLDGKIYPIEKAPPKQHWRCRCYYLPVDKAGNLIQ